MSDTADDLLDELEQLESASEDMQSKVEQASRTQASFSATETTSHLDAAALSLEAAKTAQLAAEQSQSAAEAAIKLSHEQKAQIIELSDSNVAWRQSLRVASNDLKKAKDAITIMLTVTITVSVVSVGIMSWLVYSLNKKQNALKGDVLDVITTENTLFNKNLNLKVDQLSSLIEALAADIQRLSQSTSAAQPAPAQTAPQSDQKNPDSANSTEMNGQPASQDADSSPSVTAPVDTPAQPPETTQPVVASDPPPATAETAKTVVSAEHWATLQADLKDYATQRQAQYQQIQSLLQTIQDMQSKIEASARHQLATATPKAASQAAGLTDAERKKLNGIAWSVSEQRKLLKKIEANLSAASKAPAQTSGNQAGTAALKEIQSSLKALSQQVKDLQTQQNDIQTKVHDLESITQELAARPNPYSYRAPELKIKP
ncbi:MAG: hypothetical protein ACP5D0_05010 [Hydrogenovibrio sp.]